MVRSLSTNLGNKQSYDIGFCRLVQSCLNQSDGLMENMPFVDSVSLAEGTSVRLPGFRVLHIGFDGRLPAACFVLQAMYKAFAHADEYSVRELNKHCPYPVYPWWEKNKVFVGHDFVLWPYAKLSSQVTYLRLVQ